MKIFGIVPSTASPYLKLNIPREGLPILLTKAKKEGHQAVMVDENLEQIDFNWLRKEAAEADLMAFSAITATYNKTLRYLNRLRDLGIKTPAIVGGVHVTFEPEKALDDGFDFVARHEGELMFLPFLRVLENGGDFSEIPNLCWKKNGEKVYNPISAILPDLDRDSPFPDFLDTDLFPQWKKKRMMVIETSRSCPYRCTFCSVHPMFGRYRQRENLEAVVDEIGRIRPNFVFIIDDYFAGYKNTERSKRLMELMLCRLDRIPYWGSQGRMDSARDPQWLKYAKRTHYDFHCGGIESSNDESLEEADKKQTVESIERDLAAFNKMGLGHVVHASLVVGLRGDDKYTARKLVKWMEERIPNRPQLAIVTPFPGTEFRRQLEAEGRLLPEAYNPEMCDGTHVVFIPHKMTPAELQESWNEATKEAGSRWRSFYLTLGGISNWIKSWLLEIKNPDLLRRSFKRSVLEYRAWKTYKTLRKQNKEYTKYLKKQERK